VQESSIIVNIFICYKNLIGAEIKISTKYAHIVSSYGFTVKYYI